MPLKYHQALFDLLGKQPQVSRRSVEAITKRERVLNFKLPPSLKEFYSLQGACDILYEHSNEDPVVPVDRLGDPEDLAHGVLRIQTENQDIVKRYVRLDGSDDPPVEAESEARRRKPPRGADEWGYWDVAILQSTGLRFSEFLYEQALFYGGSKPDRAAAERLEKLGADVFFDGKGNALEVVLHAQGFDSNGNGLQTDPKLAMGLVRRLERLEILRIRMNQSAPGAWAALKDHPGIRELQDYGTLDDAAVKHVVTMPALRSLTVANKRLGDAGLACLLEEHPFRTLCIGVNERISERGMAALGYQKRLKQLELSDGSGKLTDECLAGLAKLTALGELGIFSSHVGDCGLRHLARLSRLRKLRLSIDRMTDAGLAHLAELTDLTELRLACNKQITGSGLRYLKTPSNLRSLDLRELPVVDSALNYLTALEGLEHLDLRGTNITGRGFKALTALPRLKELRCAGSKVGAGAISHLARFKALQELDVSYAKLNDDDLLGLRPLRSLKKLNVTGVPLSAATIRALKTAIPTLSYVVWSRPGSDVGNAFNFRAKVGEE